MTLAQSVDEDEADAHGGSNRDSDIDIIDEDTDNSLHSMNSSALGHTSLMSFSELSGGPLCRLHVPSSDSLEPASSDASLPADLELRPGVRRYRHVPNTRLNWSLTLLAVVVAAAAVGLGVGHYLEELEACVGHQDESPHPLHTRDGRVCHEDDEYWANKLERLLLENPSLGQLLGQEASRVSLGEAGYTDCDGKKKDGAPLDLVLNQVRHVMVKSLNEENEELRSRLGHDSLREAMLISLERQVQMLQTENSQLKQKMQQVPRHERTLDRTYASRVSILRDKVNHLLIENEDLRGVVARLRYSRPLQTAAEERDPLQESLADDASSLETAEAHVDKPVSQTTAVDNDGFVLQTSEADDGVSGKTTHADDEFEKTTEVDGSPDKTAETDDNVFEKTADETEEALMVEDSKHWRRLYEQLRESRARDKTGSVWKKLLGTAQTLYDDMETAFDASLDSLFRYVKDSAELAGDLTPRLQELVTKMREEVAKKRAEFQEYMEQSSQDRDETHGAAVSRTIKLLEGSLKKVFQVGAKFMAKGKKVTEAKADKLFEKLSKVALALGRRWEKVATPGDAPSGGAETAARKKPEEEGLGKRAMDLVEEEEKKEREDWFSRRAKGRERQRGEESTAETENWYLKRQNWRREAVKTTAKPTKSRADKKTRRNSSRDHRHPSLTSEEDETKKDSWEKLARGLKQLLQTC
ncbi:conserved hypothetical protein [Ixodes scapularis]|uniref:Uncharacterized protein n=1 Tax=Ixodes scapularis TaxID=6945 RepID=B7PAP3_IXOSC|nr:conserved hypothetical protein [Ixodes scapularis]|eukprot:XP_002407093.1 conserved hypothetical protein [Ixodes scapularis]